MRYILSIQHICVFLIVAVLLLPFTVSFAQTFPDQSWQHTQPDSVGMDAVALSKAIETLKDCAGSDGVNELVIIRRGLVVWEGKHAGKTHGIWSMTKSFTSTVLGLLIDDGLCTLDTPAWSVLPELKSRYNGIRLKHFATMTSGYRAMGDEPRGSYRHGPSLTPFIPSPSPLFSPGTHFTYWDSAMNEFAHVLTRLAGISLDSVFAHRVAEPIGMCRQEWRWGVIDTLDQLAINGGAGNLGKGIYINARTLARFGLLFLHQGVWDGKRIISKEWIDQAPRVQVPVHITATETSDHGPGHYGFNWWVNGMDRQGKRKWPDAPPKTFAASGFNNNDMFIIPEWDMVIVRLGLDQNEKWISDSEYNHFLGLVGNAIR